MSDLLQLRVIDLPVQALTGIYSEETHRTQPLRVSVIADMAPLPAYAPTTPLSASKNYLDLKAAVHAALPEGVHMNLVEAIADRIATHILDGDPRVRRVEVVIDKLAISELGETIGIRLVRQR